jgi:NH3-dependent NAD+ synthetase
LPGRSLNLTAARGKIVRFIKNGVESAGADGAVVGISGGIDSAVTSYLTVEAIGNRRVLGLIMPDQRVTSEDDLEDAKLVARELGVESKVIDIAPIHRDFMKHLGPGRVAEGNLRARIRMALLYYHANLMNRLVVGTGDKSEAMLGYFCYDSKTRVMTPDGPRDYSELVPGSMVFSINLKTGKIEERMVQSVHVFDYDDRMVKIDSRHVDLLVSPNHRMLVSRNHGRGPIGYRSAESIFASPQILIPRPLPWDGRVLAPDEIGLASFLRSPLSTNANQPFRMKMPDFLYLMGLFIGDGTVSTERVTASVKSELSREEYTSSHRDRLGRFVELEGPTRTRTYHETRVFIASSEGKRSRKPLANLLDRYGIRYSSTSTLVALSNKALSNALTECGRGAKNKRIPSWVLGFPASTLRHLFQGLMDSDGDANGGAYTTTSLTLAYQMVGLCAKLGMYSQIRWRHPRKTTYKGKDITSSGTYEVRISQHIKTVAIGRENARKVHYKGKIWCPSVSPHENILVERNGKFVFCGNTKYGDGGVDLLPIGDLYKTEVRELGEVLGVSRKIVTKRSSPNLWPGQTAEGELGAQYELIDRILRLYVDDKIPASRIPSKLGIDVASVKRVLDRYAESRHKRMMPEVCVVH